MVKDKSRPLRNYVPDTGDIVWLDPQAGHEQSGHRPALVLSHAIYNGKTNRMFCCPLTTRVKGYPFEVSIKNQEKACVVLADQLESLDWQARNARYKSKALPDEVKQVKALIAAILKP